MLPRAYAGSMKAETFASGGSRYENENFVRGCGLGRGYRRLISKRRNATIHWDVFDRIRPFVQCGLIF
jgi:hypothetical protein